MQTYDAAHLELLTPDGSVNVPRSNGLTKLGEETFGTHRVNVVLTQTFGLFDSVFPFKFLLDSPARMTDSTSYVK